tara:strand:- start:148 stop:807 length:660 start_codon:yes stop_codon:yes gene_type:complete
MENIKMLELFKGTGSQGKAAIELGVLETNIVSVDMDAKWKPTILGNILELDYTKWEVPDIITASPPCETFSILISSHKNKVRDYKGDMRPLNEKGRIGDAVLFKTIEIIKYFLEKNPDIKFVIENPRGFMKKMPCMSEEPIKYICEGWYSCYGFSYRKPTNFWSNTPIKLMKGRANEDECGTKDNNVEMTTFKLAQRYRMPPLLCKAIIEQLVMEEIDI